MAYTKHTWQTGETIEATPLNNLESGVYDVTEEVESLKKSTVSATVDNTTGTPFVSVSQGDGILSFAFTSIKGEKGDTGATGATGAAGTAATVTVGTVSTLDAGESATVTNTGTTSAAVFNFGIPKGEKGDTGEQGPQGEKGDTGATGASVKSITINITGTGAQAMTGNITGTATLTDESSVPVTGTMTITAATE